MHASGPLSQQSPAPDNSAPVPAKRYRAFISYSHSDAEWAGWLHRNLERYRLPRRLRGDIGEFGPLPERLIPIFRDREDLASAGELGPRIQAALADSEALVVVCSPEAARSTWVNEEILAFKRQCGNARIYSLIVAGEPNSGAERECFPPALRFESDAGIASNPVAADVRPGKDGKSLALLKLLSGLLGVNLDSLRRREAQRRNRRMATVTGLALLVMLVTSVLAVQAEMARRAAERRQKQAENLIGFMLGDLNDKLAQVQRLDIMEAVDDQAMRYFESLPTTDVTDEGLSQRARALTKIGSVRTGQGNLAGALASYRAALKVSAPLAQAGPENIPRQLAHAEILAFIGTTHWYLGELENAQRSFEAAEKVLLQAQPRAPQDQELMFQLATLNNNFGHVLEARGRLDEAAVQYRRMLRLATQLVQLAPKKSEWAVHLGLAHNNLGKLALMRGDLAGALESYAADEAIEARLANENPKDNGQREKLAIIRATLGRTLALAGEIETGIAHLGHAVEISRSLVAVDPANMAFQEDLGLYGTQFARLLRLAGRLPDADARAREAEKALAYMTQTDPANVGWQRELAELRLEQAAQAAASARIPEARALAEAALASLDALRAKQPDDRLTVISAATARLLLADLDVNATQARRAREAALALVRGSRGDQGDPRLHALQVEALLGLGRVAEAQPVVDRLRRGGYRDVTLTRLLARHGLPYPLDGAFEQRLRGVAANRKPP